MAWAAPSTEATPNNLRAGPVRAATGVATEAVELLSTILIDPAGAQAAVARSAINERAEELRADLERELDPDAYVAAWEKGLTCTSEEAVRALLEGPPTSDSISWPVA